ncbi:MAG TPA: FlgD immunoglobulin-like domain containing protein [Melioribacteraceae bacterium]|nr:FlgD immunoglobulin-like domain containing protein [Melioribacteraceae bacterium]
MKRKIIMPFFIIAALATSILVSQSFRVSQIPNGGINSCSNCHFNPNGGGPRNSFGQTVESGFLNSQGNVVWGPSLANIDSDGDGFSNGVELQNPSGNWTGGPIGDQGKVTNPGDPLSKPNPTSVTELTIPNQYKLYNNYPNPFNPSTRIVFEIPKNEVVSLRIYDINGQLVRSLADEDLPAGRHERLWDGKDNTGNIAASGIYIYRLSAGYFDRSARMLLMK